MDERKQLLRSQLRRVIADWLKRGMEERGITQVALAKESGISRPAISAIVNERADAEDQTLERLAEALKWPLPTLRGSSGEGETEASSDDDAAGNRTYLAFVMSVLRHLETAEREHSSAVTQLAFLKKAEEIGVEQFGQRATTFIEEQRQRVQRSEKRR